MKSYLCFCLLSVLVAFGGHRADSLPIEETGLSLRPSAEVMEYTQLDARALSAAVFTSTINVLIAFTGGACGAAFVSAGVNVPADIACPIFGVATLAYAAWGHFQTVTSPRDLTMVTSSPNSVHDFVHLYPTLGEEGRPLDRLQAAYNGTERILAIHHPCSTHGCYNVWYDNHQDTDGDLIHHLALEPRGDWHLEKRQQINEGVRKQTDTGTPFYADYDFYDTHKAVEADYAHEGHNALRKDFLQADFNNKNDLHHAGYFCMNWSEKGRKAATKGVYWQSENYHMADPDALPAREQRCKNYIDPRK